MDKRPEQVRSAKRIGVIMRQTEGLGSSSGDHSEAAASLFQQLWRILVPLCKTKNKPKDTRLTTSKINICLTNSRNRFKRTIGELAGRSPHV